MKRNNYDDLVSEGPNKRCRPAHEAYTDFEHDQHIVEHTGSVSRGWRTVTTAGPPPPPAATGSTCAADHQMVDLAGLLAHYTAAAATAAHAALPPASNTTDIPTRIPTSIPAAAAIDLHGLAAVLGPADTAQQQTGSGTAAAPRVLDLSDKADSAGLAGTSMQHNGSSIAAAVQVLDLPDNADRAGTAAAKHYACTGTEHHADSSFAAAPAACTNRTQPLLPQQDVTPACMPVGRSSGSMQQQQGPAEGDWAPCRAMQHTTAATDLCLPFWAPDQDLVAITGPQDVALHTGAAAAADAAGAHGTPKPAPAAPEQQESPADQHHPTSPTGTAEAQSSGGTSSNDQIPTESPQNRTSSSSTASSSGAGSTDAEEEDDGCSTDSSSEAEGLTLGKLEQLLLEKSTGRTSARQQMAALLSLARLVSSTHPLLLSCPSDLIYMLLSSAMSDSQDRHTLQAFCGRGHPTSSHMCTCLVISHPYWPPLSHFS